MMTTAKWVTAAAAVGELQGIPVEQARRLLLEHAREGHLPMRAALFRVVRSWTTSELLPWVLNPDERGAAPVAAAEKQSSVVEVRDAHVRPDFFCGFEATTFGGYQGWCDWKTSTFTKLEADPEVHGGSITTTAVGLQFDESVVATLKPVRPKAKPGPPPTHDWESIAAMLLRYALEDPDGFYASSDTSLREKAQLWAEKQTGKRPGDTMVTNKLQEWGVNQFARKYLLKR